MRKKTVFIDTNLVNDDGSYYILETAVRKQGCTVGDIVTAYQDIDSWDAQIVCTNGVWGVILLSEAKNISYDRYEGQREGYAEGVQVQNLRIIQVLHSLNFPEKLIEEVKCKLDMV